MITKYQQLQDLIHHWTKEVSEMAYHEGIDYFKWKEFRDEFLKAVDNLGPDDEYCLPRFMDEFYVVKATGKIKLSKMCGAKSEPLEYSPENFDRILDKMDGQRRALISLNEAYQKKQDQYVEMRKRYQELKRKFNESNT